MAAFLSFFETLKLVLTTAQGVWAWIKVEENKALVLKWADAFDQLQKAQTDEERQKAAQSISAAIKSM